MPKGYPSKECTDSWYCNARNCWRCKRIAFGRLAEIVVDGFQQSRRSSVYSIRPNGYWPKDHEERMEMKDGRWIYVNANSR